MKPILLVVYYTNAEIDTFDFNDVKNAEKFKELMVENDDSVYLHLDKRTVAGYHIAKVISGCEPKCEF